MQHSVIAVNRFGYGAKSGELTLAKKAPKKWLIEQLNQNPAISFTKSLPSSSDVFKELLAFREAKKAHKKAFKEEGKVSEKVKNPAHKILTQLSADSIQQAILSTNSLNWRLLDFFSNHFSVSAAGPVMTAIAPTLEREAIAPNLLGNFEDLLLSVVQHPAMLIYLNNEKSFGANSRFGKKGRGLNENLAREILELHTLGVNGGYQQDDVIALAKGITGWSVARVGRKEGSGFLFRNNGHEPGDQMLLGKSYTRKGVEQGKSMLRDLANHPATAHHISYKLAHHFVSDNPPESLVNKLTKRWLATHGNIKEVMITLINAPESWQALSEKYKTPREFVISTLRAIGINKKMISKRLIFSLSALGQKPFNAGSPAGYSDEQADWDGGSALMARIDWAATLSSKLRLNKQNNAEEIIKQTFDEKISELTYKTVMRAESRQQALVLFLMSPEFQRR